jgi:hypothetical protein
MKGKLFLVAMLVIGLVVGMAALGFVGCETDTTTDPSPNNGRTIVLRGASVSQSVIVQVFLQSANIKTATPVGGGFAGAAIGGSDVTIEVQPVNGSFSEESYQVTIEVDRVVKYRSGVSFETSKVDMDWQSMGEPPTYGISLVQSGSDNTLLSGRHFFFTAVEQTLDVGITNTSTTEATGTLKVAVDPTLFTLSIQKGDVTETSTATGSITVDSIPVGGTGTFSVQPRRKPSGDEDMYAAMVAVTGSNDISDSFLVIFTENESVAAGDDDSIGISLSTKGHHKFTTNTALSVNVENTSDAATGALAVTVSPSDSFTLSTETIDSIDAGKTKTGAFSVQPKSGLSEGTHVAIVEVNGANGISALFTVSVSFTVNETDKTTDDPAKVQAMLDSGIPEVEYTGDKPLTGITVPANRTLVITGTIAGQAAEIKKTDATSTITNNGTINTATTDKAVLSNLVGFAGTGKVVLTGAVADVTAPLALGANLDIGAGGSITFTSGTTAFGGTKKVTIAKEGTLNLGSITGFGTATIDDNKGTITTGAVTLNNILSVAKGNITASGQVRVENDLDIPKEAILTITNKLTISGAKLTVTGTLALPDSATFVNSNGTIEAANVQALVNVLDLAIYGTVTLKATGDVTLSSPAAKISILIQQDVELTVNAGQTLKVSENVTLTVGGGGKLTGPGSLVVDEYGSVVVEETGDVTVMGSSSGDIVVTAKYTLPTGIESRPSLDGKNPVDTPKNYLDNNAPLISLAAKKDLATKIVTISLTGTVADSRVNNFKVVDLWFGVDSSLSTTTGNFAIATIKGLFDSVKTQAKLLKNYNPSWAYYTDTSFPTIQYEHPTEAPSTASDNLLWLGDEDDYPEAFNWSLREGSNDNPDEDELTLLLWSGVPAANQKARLEVTAPPNASTSPTYTVIVDWSKLIIN